VSLLTSSGCTKTIGAGGVFVRYVVLVITSAWESPFPLYYSDSNIILEGPLTSTIPLKFVPRLPVY